MDYKKEGISRLQGERLEKGRLCAHPSDGTVYELLEYRDDIAVLAWDGIVKKFPASEIFDVNALRQLIPLLQAEQSCAMARGI